MLDSLRRYGNRETRSWLRQLRHSRRKVRVKRTSKVIELFQIFLRRIEEFAPAIDRKSWKRNYNHITIKKEDDRTESPINRDTPRFPRSMRTRCNEMVAASRRGSKGDRTLGRSIAWIRSVNSRKARNKWRNACFRAITAANEARVVGSAATRQRRAPPAIKPVTNIVRGENIRQLLLQNSVARSCAHARTRVRALHGSVEQCGAIHGKRRSGWITARSDSTGLFKERRFIARDITLSSGSIRFLPGFYPRRGAEAR